MTVLNSFPCAREAEYRHGDRRGCLKKTRRAVLDGVDMWARDFTKSPVYWLNGLAGTGKSAIAQTVAERMFADGRLGASFFCSRDFEDRSNLKFIFPTLAVQLARKYPEFRSVFIPLVQPDPGIAHESLYNQLDKLIMQPLKQSAISTVIVIDALDECKDEEPASAILSILSLGDSYRRCQRSSSSSLVVQSHGSGKASVSLCWWNRQASLFSMMWSSTKSTTTFGCSSNRTFSNWPAVDLGWTIGR